MSPRGKRLRSALLCSGAVCAAASGLASCVLADKSLLAKTEPVVGDHFSVAIYEDFVGGRAHNMRTRNFAWSDGRYVATTTAPKTETRLEALRLDDGSLLVQRSDPAATLVTFWIAKPVFDGAYALYPVDESLVSAADRARLCDPLSPEGLCHIKTRSALLEIAKASAAVVPKNGALAIMQSDATQ